MDEQFIETEISLKDLNYIRIAAFIAIYTGLYDLLVMIAKSFNGRFELSMGFIFIFAGKGLLEWRNGWRKFSLFFVWLILIICPLTIISYYWESSNSHVELISFTLQSSPPFWLTNLSVIPLFIGALFVRQALSKENVKKHFELQEKKSKDWWPVSFVLAFFLCLVDVTHIYAIEGYLRKLDWRETSIYFYDAETNERLIPTISYTEQDSKFLFPKIQYSSEEDNEALFFKVSWLSGEDMEIKVSSVGYEEKALILTKDDYHKTYSVKLKKKK